MHKPTSSKSRNYWRAIGLISIFFTFFIVVGYAYWDKHRLWSNYKTTTVRIVRCSYAYKTGGYTNIDFEYKIDQQLIHSSAQRGDIREVDCNGQLLNKTFLAIYHPDKPELSALILTPADYKSINLSFPDSLKWINQYIDKEDRLGE